MTVKIRFRLDCEEVFTTDDYTFEADDWDEVLREIRSIEANNTVLSVERTDIE